MARYPSDGVCCAAHLPRRREYDLQLAAAAQRQLEEASRVGRGPGRQHRTPHTAAAASASSTSRTAGGFADDLGGMGAGGFGFESEGSAAAGGGGGELRQVDFRAWRYGVGEWMTRPRREPVMGGRRGVHVYLMCCDGASGGLVVVVAGVLHVLTSSTAAAASQDKPRRRPPPPPAP